MQRWVYSAAVWEEQEVWVYFTEVYLQCSFTGGARFEGLQCSFWVEQKFCVYSADEWVSSVNLKKMGAHSARTRSAAKTIWGQKSRGPLKMSREMAHKVIVPQKKIRSPNFLNSGTLVFLCTRVLLCTVVVCCLLLGVLVCCCVLLCVRGVGRSP